MTTFEEAAAAVKALSNVSQENQLKLYGLFKQATKGNVDTERPGMLDMTGKAKWDAWKAREGMDSEAAKAEYVALVAELSK